MDSHFSLQLYLEITGNINAFAQKSTTTRTKITKTRTRIEIYASSTTNKI